MEFRLLGSTGVRVSRLSFGAMTFGSQTDEGEAAKMVVRCLDAGINFFDTADMYNLGKSEEILGRALRGRRGQVVLASKVRQKMGDDPNQQGLSRRWILAEVEASLRRLGTDYLDVYYMHSPDKDTPMEESLAAMDALVRSGKVRYAGLSNFSSWQFCRMLWLADRRLCAGPVVSQMMYNVLARAVEAEHLAFCQEFRVGVVVYNPLAGGLLTGKHEAGAEPAEGTRFHKNDMYLRRYWNEMMFGAVERLKEVAARAGKSMVQLSLQWLLGRAAVDSVILGASRLAQLEENLAAAEGALDRDTSEACDQIYALLSGPIPRYNR